MFTCEKSYRDIPIAHRQHTHTGRCRFIHGHNWAIHITFASKTLDSCGFVIDLGNLKYLKKWIDKHLDHACLIGEHDPILATLQNELSDAFKLYIIPSASCEGLAEHLFSIFNDRVQCETQRRVWITKIRVSETEANSAQFESE